MAGGPLPGYKARAVINGVIYKWREGDWREDRKEGDTTNTEDAGDEGFESGLRLTKRLTIKLTQASLDLAANLFLAPTNIATEDTVSVTLYFDKNDVTNRIECEVMNVIDLGGKFSVDSLQPFDITLKSVGDYLIEFTEA